MKDGMHMKISIAVAIGAALLIVGCNRHQEPVQQEQQQVKEAPKPAAPPKPEAEPVPVAAPKPVVQKPKPLPPTPAEQQVLDDADATGMTARTDRSSGDGDETAPADTNRQE